MISQAAIGWLSVGFLVGVAVTYGIAMSRAYWVKAQAVAMMKDANKSLRASTEMAKEATLAHKKYGELQDKHLELLAEYEALGEEMMAERKEYSEFLRKYEALLIEHKALLWRAGGGVEGTA